MDAVYFREWASRLVGARPAELAQWAHDAKVARLATALAQAYQQGRRQQGERGQGHGPHPWEVG